MTSDKQCAECGAMIPEGSPRGLCSQCLLSLGLQQRRIDPEITAPAASLKSARQPNPQSIWSGQEEEYGAPGASVVPLITEKPGDQIGRYKLLQQIGEGGFGVVYMAQQQEPVKRRVALKIIKLGMDTKQVVARFEAERQALALMDHPNIAKILDGGATETGRPYFVMELVHGIKITEYCDQNNLSMQARLELFIQICRAIQHAHQKGIIHRDIKPSNIMVMLHDGRPVPKIIDFGIAKATQAELTEQTVFTQFGQFIGTPAYMSPEQAEMSGLDVDTRSDIYSLGVLLYELLTGKTPFDTQELLAAGVEKMRRIIREKEPNRPSTRLGTLSAGDLSTTAKHRQVEPLRLLKLVRGDLDWIVMKCLEKDRTRRYETANGLAVDAERHLKQEPVLARSPSNLYRFQKLVERNRLAFAAAGAVVAALVVGLGISTWMFIQEVRARNRADVEAKKSQQVARFLKEMLQGVGPSKALGHDSAMLREILDRTAERLGKELTNQPEVEIELGSILADTYRELGLFQKMEAIAREDLRLAKATHGAESLSVAQALEQVAVATWRLGGPGKLQEAADSERQALAIRRKLLGDEHLDVGLSLGVLGMILSWEGKLSEAETVERQALAIRRNLLPEENLDVAQSLTGLEIVLAYENKLDEAEKLARQALSIRTNLLGNYHPSVAASLNNLGYVLQHEGKLSEAETIYRDVLTTWRSLLPGEHPDIALSLYNLAFVLCEEGNLTNAESLFRESLTMRRKLLGPENQDVAFSLEGLAEVFRLERKLSEAEALHGEALKMRRLLLGAEHPLVVNSLTELGLVLWEERKFDQAETLQHEALAIRKKLPGNTDVAINLYDLALILFESGQLAGAEGFARECLEIREKALPNAWQTFDTRSLLGGILLRQRKYDASEPLLLSGYSGMKQHEDKIPYYSKDRLKQALKRLVELFEATGQTQQASEWRTKLNDYEQEQGKQKGDSARNDSN